jgi:hypothetical protein
VITTSDMIVKLHVFLYKGATLLQGTVMSLQPMLLSGNIEGNTTCFLWNQEAYFVSCILDSAKFVWGVDYSTRSIWILAC